MKSWLVMLAFAVIGLSGVTAKAAEQAYNTSGTIVYFDSSGNATLDPAEPQNGSSYSHESLLAIYDTLIRYDQAGNLTPGLAESWEVAPDLKGLTLKLRHGVTFHDGTPFNAAAVKRNFERSASLGGRAGNTMADTFRRITAVETIGDDVVKLTFNEPNGQIPFRLAYNAGMMISPAVLSEGVFGSNLKPIGAGPYKVMNFEANIKTQMVRFDSYWGGIEGRPAGFDNHYVPDSRARFNAVASGQATIALIEPRQIAEAKSKGLTVQVIEKNALWDIYLNVSRPGLKDVRVRQAMMHAIDREAIAEAMSYGTARPTEQLWATTSPFYIPELDKRYPFDQAKARKLLAEAGFKDGLDVTILLLNTTEYRQLAEAIQGMWAEIGIRLKYDVIDVSQYTQFSRPTPRGDIMMGRNGGRGDAVEGLAQIVGTGGTVNPGGVVSPRIDELLGVAKRLSPTDPKRLEALLAVSREISEGVANIPVITRATVYAYRPDCIKNLQGYMPAGDERFNDVRIGANCK